MAPTALYESSGQDCAKVPVEKALEAEALDRVAPSKLQPTEDEMANAREVLGLQDSKEDLQQVRVYSWSKWRLEKVVGPEKAEHWIQNGLPWKPDSITGSCDPKFIEYQVPIAWVSTSSVKKNTLAVPSQTATFNVNKGTQKTPTSAEDLENLEKKVNKFKDTFSNLMKTPLEEFVIGNMGPTAASAACVVAEAAYNINRDACRSRPFT